MIDYLTEKELIKELALEKEAMNLLVDKLHKQTEEIRSLHRRLSSQQNYSIELNNRIQ